ncbi:MAG: VanZ family protein [Oscillospiraceae bacterium]|nr:VanZ family protein [Oscillospiraceae bacterium]
MIEITYLQMLLAITGIWFFVRAICWVESKRLEWKRELQLLLVYICIVVVVRFTFCSFGTVDGKIQPLLFDPERIFPLWLNLKPFVYLFDYPSMKEALLNLIGNTAMFIPLGVVWPAVFPKLDRHAKVIAAGFGVSLCIEVLQLPFFDRATDIDDLILNTAGYLIGYGVYLLARKIKRFIQK